MDEDYIMKKEDMKESVKEAQRIFVENLPKPKGWWQENAGIIIALLALAISLYSAYLSREEFIAARRPYVYVSDRKNDNGTMDVKSVLLHCLNAPARIIDQEFCYVVVETKENGEEKVTKTIPWTSLSTSNTLYPSEETSGQVFCKYDFKKEILEKDPKVRLRRKVRIDYKELSTDRTYYFEGNWDYDRDRKVWKIDNMFGN